MKWAYHTTLRARLNNIKKKGLVMHSKHVWPDRLWFTDTSHGYPPNELEIILKFPWPEDAIEEFNCNDWDPREFFIRRPVPANTIYKYFKKKWVKLCP